MLLHAESTNQNQWISDDRSWVFHAHLKKDVRCCGNNCPEKEHWHLRHLTAEEFCDMVENQNDDCDCGYDAEWEEKIEKEFEEKFDSKDEESKK